MLSMAKVNSLYGDVSRDGLWATGVLLLGAGGDADKHQLVISVISIFWQKTLKVDLGYLFLDKVDALPSMEKIAKALDKVNIAEK